MALCKILIIGGGGHAKVLIDSVLSRGTYAIEGILDNNLGKGDEVLGIPVLGGDELLDNGEYRAKDFVLCLGVGIVKASNKRKLIYEKYKQMGFLFPAIIHSKAHIAKSAICGDGIQVMAGAVIQSCARIGENVIVNTSAVVEHDCRVGPHCHIAPSAVLGGDVEVGECSHIGMGAKILNEIKIGYYTTVGAGAVVTRDVANRNVVAGVPAGVING